MPVGTKARLHGCMIKRFVAQIAYQAAESATRVGFGRCRVQ